MLRVNPLLVHARALAHAPRFMTMIYFAEFPFDNICIVRNPELGAAEAFMKVDPEVYVLANREFNVQSDVLFTRCDQVVTFGALRVLIGGVVTRDSMNPKQRRVVTMYSYLVFGLTCLLFVSFFGFGIIFGTIRLFKGGFHASSEPQDDHFSDCEGMQAYIPFVTHSKLAYPLVAADMRTFNCDYLAFEMPNEEMYMMQNLYNPQELPGFSELEFKQLFSEVKHYPPPEGLVERPDGETGDYDYGEIKEELDSDGPFKKGSRF